MDQLHELNHRIAFRYWVARENRPPRPSAPLICNKHQECLLHPAQWTTLIALGLMDPPSPEPATATTAKSQNSHQRQRAINIVRPYNPADDREEGCDRATAAPQFSPPNSLPPAPN